MDQEWSRWRSCHFYYHGGGDLLLARLVRPLMSSLLAAGAIDRFFFIRYELGGPHVRLRLRLLPGAESAVNDTVNDASTQFFARWPSVETLPGEIVQRRNREILALDPGEGDATIHPDNCLRFQPFVPEVDRYGGPELIGASLDYFALSSVRALDFAHALGAEPRNRQLPWILRTLARQARGFARDGAEMLALLGYAQPAGDHPLAPFAARGDRAFEEQPEIFRNLLLAAAEDPGIAESRGLAREVAAADPTVRQRILRSHMHMTANRLGLRNPEEVYLGRILQQAAGALGNAAWPAPVEPLDAKERLEDLLQAAFAAMLNPGAQAAAPAGASPRR